ncbi:response regulator transcription factor [Paenibacillus spongiae]|uniref:Response regulator transcription factor n=1 Tax=Paenibacillus spongiae TaxID=2909671 RepID=A0ABY5S6G3_9BACL|nr:response regulator transcription factor [Paenibacillus spongiae]UVI29249.1 response regulator transcription factor [Paenibacillus spongiae]
MPNEKIVVVEDETAIAELLVYALQKEGYRVRHAATGQEAIDLVRSFKPEMLLLDLMLPDLSGFDLCKSASRDNWGIPIIMLTAKSDTVDKILGIELGADDYIVKPFDIREVVARIRAVFRRIELVAERFSREEAAPIIVGEGIEISKQKREVKKCGEPVELKNKEFDLLLFLAENQRIVFTRAELLDKVWGFTYSGDTRTVDIHVQRIRKKLDAPDSPSCIETVFGVGYRLR